MITDYKENREIRIFISSTFQNMQDERDYLMKHIFPELQMIAAEREVTLTAIDLRWGITDEESKQGKVIEICLKEVENCIPFFIGIVGNRYGWCPKPEEFGQEIIQQFSELQKYYGLSITEMEMKFGVFDRKDDVYASFYIDSNELEDSKVDYPDQLKAFKESISQNRKNNGKEYPVSYYDTKEKLGEEVRQSVLELLNNLFPECKGNSMHLREKQRQESFRKQLTKTYIINQEYFSTLDLWLNDWSLSNFVVTGSSGIGKSALLANWVEHIKEENKSVSIIYCSVGKGIEIVEANAVISYICQEIISLLKVHESLIEQDKNNDINYWLARLSSTGSHSLIVLDAINQIANDNNEKQLYWIPAIPRNVKVLFSSIKEDLTYDVFIRRNYRVLQIQPLSVFNRKNLIKHYLKKISKRLPEEGNLIDDIVNDEQCQNTLVLKTLLSEIVSFGYHEKLSEKIHSYLGKKSIPHFFEQLLTNYESDFGEELIKAALSLIVLSKNGIQECVLIDILEQELNKKIQLNWSQFYCWANRHFSNQQGFLTFSHHFIVNAIKNRYFYNNEEFIKELRIRFVNNLISKESKIYYDEICYQLYQVQDWDRLHEKLIDKNYIDFLFNKQRDGDLYRYWIALLNEDKCKYSLRDYDLTAGAYQSIQELYDFYSNIAFMAGNILCDNDFERYYRTKQLEIVEAIMAEEKISLDFRYSLPNFYQDYALSFKYEDREKFVGYCNYSKLIALDNIEYARKNIQEIKDFNRWNSYQYYLYSQACHNLSVYIFEEGEMNTDPSSFEFASALEDEALTFLRLVKDFSKDINYINNFTAILCTKANCEKALSHNDKAFELYNEAISILSDDIVSIDPSLRYVQATILFNRAALNRHIADFDSALCDYDKVLNICKDLDFEIPNAQNRANIASVYEEIGLLYQSMHNSKSLDSIDYLKKSRDIYEQCVEISHEYASDLSRIDNNIAFCLYEDLQLYSACEKYVECIKYRENLYKEGKISREQVNKSILFLNSLKSDISLCNEFNDVILTGAELFKHSNTHLDELFLINLRIRREHVGKTVDTNTSQIAYLIIWLIDLLIVGYDRYYPQEYRQILINEIFYICKLNKWRLVYRVNNGDKSDNSFNKLNQALAWGIAQIQTDILIEKNQIKDALDSLNDAITLSPNTVYFHEKKLSLIRVHNTCDSVNDEELRICKDYDHSVVDCIKLIRGEISVPWGNFVSYKLYQLEVLTSKKQDSSMISIPLLWIINACLYMGYAQLEDTNRSLSFYKESQVLLIDTIHTLNNIDLFSQSPYSAYLNHINQAVAEIINYYYIYNTFLPYKEYEYCLFLIEKVLILCPNNDYFKDTKAELLYRTGREAEALALSMKIAKSNPQYYPSCNEYLYNEYMKYQEWKDIFDQNKRI